MPGTSASKCSGRSCIAQSLALGDSNRAYILSRHTCIHMLKRREARMPGSICRRLNFQPAKIRRGASWPRKSSPPQKKEIALIERCSKSTKNSRTVRPASKGAVSSESNRAAFGRWIIPATVADVAHSLRREMFRRHASDFARQRKSLNRVNGLARYLKPKQQVRGSPVRARWEQSASAQAQLGILEIPGFICA
jgi:hypothetical protein